MGIVMFFVWVTFGVAVYFIELGYRKFIMGLDRQYEPEGVILYGAFGVVTIFFLLYTILTHIQRIQERKRYNGNG